MAIPRVFVSSTLYDIKYIRENIKYFIKTIGFEPVLSEDGNIFYDPKIHVQDACLTEIPNCQMFVLIIGGRHRSSFKDDHKSITNVEYLEAVKLKIPVFALVESGALNDYHLYHANKDNNLVDAAKIKYNSVDSILIFDFIDSIKVGIVNNALVPFRDFSDIEAYLRQQWAGMLFSFLSNKNEHDRIVDSIQMLRAISERVEMLSTQILQSVGTETAKLNAALYDLLLQEECIRDIAYMGGRPTPSCVIKSESFSDCCIAAGVNTLKIETSWDGSAVGPSGGLSQYRFESNTESYIALRVNAFNTINKSGLNVDEYLRNEPGLLTISP